MTNHYQEEYLNFLVLQKIRPDVGGQIQIQLQAMGVDDDIHNGFYRKTIELVQ